MKAAQLAIVPIIDEMMQKEQEPSLSRKLLFKHSEQGDSSLRGDFFSIGIFFEIIVLQK